MHSQLIFKFTHFLFHKIYWLYKLLYFAFKKKQDARELALMKQFINPSHIIVDVGANIGFYASYFSKLTGPKGKVYCFEPDAYNYKRLLQTTRSLTNVLTTNAAVSSTNGHLDFYLSHDKNVDHRAYAPESYASKHTVDCISLDSFLGDDVRIDILKVDVQGYEMQVYEGAKQLLAANPNLKIFSEFWPYGLQQAGASKESFLNFFTQLGFLVYHIQETGLTKITPETLDSFPIDERAYFNVLLSKEVINS